MAVRRTTDFDVVVVGGRCAGATLGALLGLRGMRVLVVDQNSFPSASLSTHTMHGDALAVLRNAGVLPQVAAIGAPRITEVVCDYGDFQIVGSPPPVGGIDYGLCVPRYSLDEVLLRHAERCGAAVEEGTRAVDVLAAEGTVCGVSVRRAGSATAQKVTAGLVVGADGRLSTVARLANARYTHQQRSGWYLWFGYLADLPPRQPPAYELYFQGASFWYVFPTTGGLHVVGGEFAFREHPRQHGQPAAAFESLLRKCARLRDRLGPARLVDGPYGMFRIDSFMREPSGAGWALVGDASFFKDPCTGQGMYDALRGAERLAERIWEGRQSFGDPCRQLAGYGDDRHREFDEWYRFTCRAAQALPVSAERRRVLRTVAEDVQLSNEYLGIQNHAVRPSAFFARREIRAAAIR